MCDSIAWYECCGTYLCQNDYDRHFKNRSKHNNFKQINQSIDNYNKIILKNNLRQRITSLKKVKKEIISNTKSLLKSILSLQESAVSLIKKKINRYDQFLRSEYYYMSDEHEINEIICKKLYIELKNVLN